MDSLNDEIRLNASLDEPDEPFVKKPYIKHKLEGGNRTPTRLEYLFYKNRLKQKTLQNSIKNDK